MTLEKGKTYDVNSLVFTGWKKGTESAHDGYNVYDYFTADGTYLGPDDYGIEPICQTTSKENSTEWRIGDSVVAGEGADEDEGIIEELDNGKAFVAWQSGVKTWTPIVDLR